MERTINWICNAHTTPLTRRLIQAAVWICVIALAAVHIPVPLTGDQALYMYGAKSLAEGQALYLDFWDVKQPGVYLFYLLAGSLFSFSEIGLHTLEALWFGLAAWFGYRIGRQSGPENVLVLLIPLFTAGTYFVAVSAWHMSQPDGLLTTPLAGVAWALCDRQLRINRYLPQLIAGIFGGIAAVFKVSVLIVPVVMLVAWYLIRARCEPRGDSSYTLREGLVFALGLLIPIGSVAIWFALRGALAELIWTTFHYPFIALAEIEHYTYNLYDSARWFIDMTIFLAPLAAVGGLWSIVSVLHRRDVGLPGVLMLVWLLVGSATIFMQYHYFWAFHFNQFFVPVGILAVIGLRVMFDSLSIRVSAWAGPALVALAVFTLVAFGNRATVKLASFVAAVVSHDSVLSAYADEYEPKTNKILQSVDAALSGTSPTESIYVFGDPRLLLASGRSQVVPENGWALEIMTGEQWKLFSDRLRKASPTHLYVSDYYTRLLNERFPELVQWISDEYDLYYTDTMAGIWYRRRSNLSDIEPAPATAAIWPRTDHP